VLLHHYFVLGLPLDFALNHNPTLSTQALALEVIQSNTKITAHVMRCFLTAQRARGLTVYDFDPELLRTLAHMKTHGRTSKMHTIVVKSMQRYGVDLQGDVIASAICDDNNVHWVRLRFDRRKMILEFQDPLANSRGPWDTMRKKIDAFRWMLYTHCNVEETEQKLPLQIKRTFKQDDNDSVSCGLFCLMGATLELGATTSSLSYAMATQQLDSVQLDVLRMALYRDISTQLEQHTPNEGVTWLRASCEEEFATTATQPSQQVPLHFSFQPFTRTGIPIAISDACSQHQLI